MPVKHKHFLTCYLGLKGFLKIILNVMEVVVLSSSTSLPKYLPSLDPVSRGQKCALAKLQKVLGLAKLQHSKKLDAFPGAHLYIRSTTLAAARV